MSNVHLKYEARNRRITLTARVLLLCGLTCALLGGAYGLGARQAVAASQEPPPVLREPLSPAITGKMVVQQLLPLEKLAAVEYRYTNVGRFEDHYDFHGWKVPFTAKSFVASWDGAITAGVDLRKIQVAVDSQSRTVTVTLPKSEILSHEIFEDTLRVFEETGSALNPTTIQDYSGFIRHQKELAAHRAVAKGLLAGADQKARETVLSLLSLLPGAESYTLTVK